MIQDSQLPLLIKSLMDPEVFDHVTKQCQLIQTHISWVLLTGSYAYKIKKPVNLGFLYFSTMEKRHFYCEEELRLNRRLAPDIYLEVVEIKGTPEHPSFGGDGEIIEYTVKMVQFPQEVQLDRVLRRGDLDAKKIEAIAHMISNFHKQVDTADKDSPYGEPEKVFQPVMENFTQIREHIDNNKYSETLAMLQTWCESTYIVLKPVLLQRKIEGFIRECHGDMHLRNLAWYNGSPLAFDCLEFNASLRWIDVISEVAFLKMDLQDNQQEHMAQRFLNTYLDDSGDHAGIKMLRFYLVYRAMVRAKVDAIRMGQSDISHEERDDAEQDFAGYLQLANSYLRPTTPQLIITRGLSASGKTTETQRLLELLGAIRVRSDVERKRLFGIKTNQDAGAAIGEGIYSANATKQTYERLVKLASIIIDAGYTVIIDAANLKPEQRKLFHQLASQKKIPYIIIEFTAEKETLRKRIMQRKDDASDANLKVLEKQFEYWQPLSEKEQSYAISIDTEQTYDVLALAEKIKSFNYGITGISSHNNETVQ